MDLFPSLRLIRLSRGMLDHCPFLIREDLVKQGRKPFKSLDCWLKHLNFHVVVSDFWKDIERDCLGNYQILKKLNALKGKLKCWNKLSFGNKEQVVKDLHASINHLVHKAESVGLRFEEQGNLSTLISKRWKANRNLESIQRQKARLNWVILGDRNTCFFYMSARLHNNKNHIQKVMQNEICLKLLMRLRIGHSSSSLKYLQGPILTDLYWEAIDSRNYFQDKLIILNEQ